MSKIMWDTEVNAPGCVGQILKQCPVLKGGNYRESDSVLIQSDWDYPGVAYTFGWSIQSVQKPEPEFDDDPATEFCDHDGTDGTIDCPNCGIKVDQFLESARKWLEDHDGATAEDPGYFTE